MAMKVDETMLDGLTAQCKTPQDVAELYTQMLQRVIDLTRIACAAQLLANPGYTIPTVVRILHFASASHLSGTARRIANVPTSGLGGLGPRGVLAAFVRGNTRSRM